MERRQRAAVLGLVVMLFFSSCSDTRSPIEPPAPAVSTSREFSVGGGVRDTAFRPLVGSRVEVVDGPRAGTTATTDRDGRFSLPGTFNGTITLVASKDGYTSETRRLPPPLPPERLPPPQDGARWESAFNLEPLGPSVDAAGVYALTLTVDRACKLPDEARTRTYTARISADGRSRFLARLSDARFFSTVPCPTGQPPETCTYNRFWIGVAGDYASIFVGILEQLGETTYLVFSAGSQGSFGPTGLTATLDGDVLYCPREPFLIDQGTWSCPADGVVCDSDNHQFRLVRR